MATSHASQTGPYHSGVRLGIGEWLPQAWHGDIWIIISCSCFLQNDKLFFHPHWFHQLLYTDYCLLYLWMQKPLVSGTTNPSGGWGKWLFIQIVISTSNFLQALVRQRRGHWPQLVSVSSSFCLFRMMICGSNIIFISLEWSSTVWIKEMAWFTWPSRTTK